MAENIQKETTSDKEQFETLIKSKDEQIMKILIKAL